jgi:hypothetical protein
VLSSDVYPCLGTTFPSHKVHIFSWSGIIATNCLLDH